MSASSEADQLFREGRSLYSQGRRSESAAIYGQALEISPNHYDALLSLGRIRQQEGQLDEAEALFLRASDTVDGPDLRALILLSSLHDQRESYGEAIDIAQRCTKAFPDNDMAWRHLGNMFMHQRNMDEAWAAYGRAHALLREPGSKHGLERPGFKRTTRAKLKHDIEQLQYLMNRQITDKDFSGVIGDYNSLLEAMPKGLDDGAVVNLPPRALQAIAEHYNRCHYQADAQPLDDGAINPDLDTEAICDAYFSHAPGITWVDDLLRPEALDRLRNFCLESTIWYDADHPNGYVGAYVYDGFACPLLKQITQELPATLPRIFKDRPLTQLWAYKYDSTLSGIEMHADTAAINVNFWLTPTGANEDSETGGLVLWDKEVPLDWHSDEFNRSDPAQKAALLEYLQQQGAQQVRVSYRQNRAVVFNSDLLHKTDDIHFKPGYENRRINVTMLYGWRE